MKHKRLTSIAAPAALATCIAVLAGCGGSSSDRDEASTSTSTIASRGMITGFGSVYVNGKRFHTGAARIVVDDEDATESELRIGMIVTVHGSTDDRLDWRAERIEYDNELKGPVSSITPDLLDPTRKTLVILGQTVEINANTTFDDYGGLSFLTLALDDVLEVSGFTTGSGLVATHVELQDNDLEIEIRGRIESLTPGVGFSIKGFPVTYDGTTELEDLAEPVEGLLVEVEGQLDAAGTTLLARKIEGEDDDLDEDRDEFEIEGVISEFDPDAKTFVVQGQAVDARNAILFPTSLVLDDGVTVEVDGHIVNGVLLAEKVKQRGKKVKISAPLAAVGSDSVTFRFNGGDVQARVNPQTELEDESGNPVVLSAFSAGHFVELEAFADGSGLINAIEIERESPDKIEIEAPLDDFDGVSKKVKLLGVEFDLAAASFENANDVPITAAEFYGALRIGRFIEIEDADRNGVFEKAELED